MLEWHALARGVAGVFPESRQLERWVPPDVGAELPGTFARYADVFIAEALVRSQALFRRLAREVADRWDLPYPDAVDSQIKDWVGIGLRRDASEPIDRVAQPRDDVGNDLRTFRPLSVSWRSPG